MRYLVLALILLNLGWMAWYFWIYEAPPANAVEEQVGSARLTLAKQATPEQILPELEATEDDKVASVDLDTGAVVVPPEPEPAPERREELQPAAETQLEVAEDDAEVEEFMAEFEAETEPEAIAEQAPAGALEEQRGGEESAPEPELVAEAAVDDIEEAAPPPGRCVSLGSFSDQAPAKAAIAKLSDAGYTATRRELIESVSSGTWVFLSGYATRAEANKVVTSLKEQGIRDLMLMPAADTPHISLGFFSNPKLAAQREREIRRLGHEPQSSDRFRDATRYWLDFEIPATGDFDVTDYGRNLELNDCP